MLSSWRQTVYAELYYSQFAGEAHSVDEFSAARNKLDNFGKNQLIVGRNNRNIVYPHLTRSILSCEKRFC